MKVRQEEIIYNVEQYIKQTESITNTIDYLEMLTSFGYPVQFNMQAQVHNGDISQCQLFEERSKSIKDTWITDLEDAYHQYEGLRYLSGEQFWILDEYFQKKNKGAPQMNLLNFVYEGIALPSKSSYSIGNLSASERLQMLGKKMDGRFLQEGKKARGKEKA